MRLSVHYREPPVHSHPLSLRYHERLAEGEDFPEGIDHTIRLLKSSVLQVVMSKQLLFVVLAVLSAQLALAQQIY